MFCACNNWSDADDLAQECYLRAARSWDQFDGSGSRQAWLFTIARNAHIDWFRRRTRQEQVLEAESRARVSEQPVACEPDDIEVVWKAANGLRRDQRDVIHLRFAAGLSYAEMADTLKVPVGTVRSRLHRSLKMLREQIEE